MLEPCPERISPGIRRYEVGHERFFLALSWSEGRDGARHLGSVGRTLLVLEEPRS